MKSTITKILQKLDLFVPRNEHGDTIWEFYLPFHKRWYELNIKEYSGGYYFYGSDWETISTDNIKSVTLEKKNELFFSAVPALLLQLYKQIKKDPIEYHVWLAKNLSVHLRKGIIPRVFARELIPDWCRYDLDLSPTEIKLMLQVLDSRLEPTVEKMTSQKFFDYCRVAYLANGKKSHKELKSTHSGFQLYDRWADSRDGGLKTIPRNSSKAFEDWYNGDERSGCHPWEIYRGGNSTHIDLAVVKESHNKRWKILLSAFSSSRLAETCRIAIALHKAKMPFELDDKDSYQLRLTGSDWIGVLPRHHGIAYGWHDFPKDWHVADCIHFSRFKDEKGKTLAPMKKIKNAVTWFPINVVRIK